MNKRRSISVLLPSRGRPGKLLAALDALKRTSTGDPDQVEILIKLDHDDPESLALCPQLLAFSFAVRIVIINRHEKYKCVHEYYNMLGRIATGHWLVHYADDAEMLTKDWDQSLAKLQDVLPWWSVLEPQSLECPNCFPIVSRRLFDTIGHFSLHISLDGWMEQIGKALGCLVPIGIRVGHHKPELDGTAPDQTRMDRDQFLKEYENEQHRYIEDPYWQTLIQKDVERIKENIDERRCT